MTAGIKVTMAIMEKLKTIKTVQMNCKRILKEISTMPILKN